MSKEKWLPVKGYEGIYEVSDQGRVRSLSRTRKVSRVHPGQVVPLDEEWAYNGKILKPVFPHGTSAVHLYDANGKRSDVAVKRLVAQAFLSDFSEGITTNSIHLIDASKGPQASNIYVGASLGDV